MMTVKVNDRVRVKSGLHWSKLPVPGLYICIGRTATVKYVYENQEFCMLDFDGMPKRLSEFIWRTEALEPAEREG